MTTIDKIQSHLMHRPTARMRRLGKVPEIVCADGFAMSVQASETHYCSPRNATGPWASVEVGYPSQDEPLLGEDFNQDVWGYVPVSTVAAIIDKHGGFK